MRHLLLVLMIALLPLRGWVGDAMAMEMAVQVAAQTAARLPDTSAAAPGHDACPDHGDAVALAAGADPHAMAQAEAAPTSHGGCIACIACQVCHSAAVAMALPVVPALPLPAAMPALQPSIFASAVPAPGFKPPIS